MYISLAFYQCGGFFIIPETFNFLTKEYTLDNLTKTVI